MLVEVGPEKTQFYLSKRLLCATSDYFKTALKGDFKEGKENSIYLEDCSSKIFTLFVDWLYSNSDFYMGTLKNSGQFYPTCLKLCLLALRLLTENFQNELIDEMVKYSCAFNEEPEIKLLQEVWDKSPPRCGMRRFILDHVIERGRLKGLKEDYVTSSSFSFHVARRLRNKRGRRLVSYELRERCKSYHQHSNDLLCEGILGDEVYCDTDSEFGGPQ